jgi:predicted dehydrogenase
MTDFDRVRVGMIGYGIGKLYAASLLNMNIFYSDMPPIDLVAIATSSDASGQQAMKQFGFQRHVTDYRSLLESDDINTLVIAIPHYLHREMLLAALRTDKAIYNDKPLANNLAEAREIVALAHQRNRDAQLSFVVRYCPALQHAKKVIEEKRLGEIYAFRFRYFRSSYSDPLRPLRWKGSMAQSGGGVLNDLVPHLADLLLWLVGQPDQLVAQTRTFVKERPPVKGSEQRVPIETDDHVIMQITLPNGAIGTIESGRLVHGATNDIELEIYGSEGGLRCDLTNPNYLYLVESRMPEDERGWLRVPTVQRYPDAVIPGADLPVGQMRFFIACMADFLRKTRAGQPYDPGLEQGLRVQAITEAALQSARDHSWIPIARE